MNFFDVLGVRPLLGRTFLPEDGTKPGGNPVLVISEGLWHRRFGGDAGVIGRQVELNRHSFTIIGVAPARFRGTMSGVICDFWAPVTMHKEVANFGSLNQRADRWLHTQARLQPRRQHRPRAGRGQRPRGPAGQDLPGEPRGRPRRASLL